MKKHLPSLILLAFAVFAFSQISNWKGYLDTTIIWCKDTTAIKYSKTYPLTECVAISLVTLANDTTAAGLSADSTSFIYGIQTGSPVINGSGSLDTAWGSLDTLDSLSAAKYGTVCGTGRYSVTTDLVTEVWGLVDTSTVTGYAYQVRPARPYNWSPLLRAWYLGKTGTRLAKPTKIVANIQRMVGVPTVAK
jgi:hypothetical protein